MVIRRRKKNRIRSDKMKLQKQLSRKVDGKVYDKWVVVLPPEDVKKIGWKAGQEIEASVKGDSVVLKPKKD